MAARPSFVPQSLLVVPGFFGEQPGPEWKLASSYPAALRLARAKEQHDLAYAVHAMRTERKRSVPDVAAMLGVPRGNLGAKLRGRTPATEEDLIAWSWLTGTQRGNYTPESLLVNPTAIEIPRFLVRPT